MTEAATTTSVAEESAIESGDLPEGWERVPLSRVTVPVQNVNPPSTPDRVFYYVDISSIDNERQRLTEAKELRGKDAPSRARRPIQAGDVLFSNVRTYLRNIALVPDGSKANVCSTGFTVLRPNAAVLPQYLFYWVITNQFIDEVTPTQTGTHYPATSDRAVLGASICIPPLAEQKRIVAEIERLLAEVNKAREHLNRVPNILKRFRQSILAAATTGRLTEDWRAGTSVELTGNQLVEAIQQKRVELGLKSAERVIDDEDIELPEDELPETWCWCRAGQIADVRLGGTPSRKVPKYWDGSVPWVSSGEVANCRIAATAERITDAGVDASSAKLYPKGTVLIAMIGEGKTRGQSAILDIAATTNQNVAGLVFDAGYVEPEYVWLWALAEYEKTRSIGRGGNQPALNGRKVRALPMPLPPLEEQRQIVERARMMLTVADEIEVSTDLAIRKSELVPQAILAKALRGELVPTEAELARTQNRPYESATQLLARISKGTDRDPQSSSNPEARKRTRQTR